MSNDALFAEPRSSLHDVELEPSFGVAILDIASVRPPPAQVEAEKKADSTPPPPPPDPVVVAREERSRALERIAAYGPPPRNILFTVPYFVRVMLRRREVDEELAKLTAARAKLDTLADDALCELAEALVLREAHVSLEPLREQIHAVMDSRKQLSATAAASRQAREHHKAELTRIKSAVAKVELEAAPVRKREAALRAEVDDLASKLEAHEAQQRKLAAELEALRASTEPTAAARVTSAQAEQGKLAAQAKAKQAQLAPLRADLSIVHAELTTLLDRIKGLREEEHEAMRAMEREQQRHRSSTEGARGAHRDALRALARAAQEGDLVALVSKENKAALDAEEHARQKRDLEDLQRSASLSFDAQGYQRGMYILVGGTAGLFLLLMLLILF